MRFLLAVLLAIAVLPAAAQNLEILPLRHRTVDQVLPVLRPLLEPGGALSGQGNQLFVRTSPANLSQLRSVLEAIDQPARRLMVSVRFDQSDSGTRSGIDGDVRLSTRGESSARVRIDDSRSASGERVDQRIQVLEGGRAFIASAESRPLPQRQVIRTPGGTVVTETAVIQEASTGFEVVPRVSGSTVTLDVAPQRQTFAPGGGGVIQSQQVASTVSGRLGEWIELGGVDISGGRQESGVLSSRSAAATGGRRVWIRVEELR